MSNANYRLKAFGEGQKIPVRHTGRGEDLSPELKLKNIHPQAKSLAIIMDDLDIPLIPRYNHWLIFNIPVCEKIPEGIAYGPKITEPFPAVQGLAYGKHCYRGPKSPRFIRNDHRYIFSVYVLDCTCGLGPETNKKEWQKSMKGHILQQASLCGTFRNADVK